MTSKTQTPEEEAQMLREMDHARRMLQPEETAYDRQQKANAYAAAKRCEQKEAHKRASAKIREQKRGA